jgi:hypothetical protein
VTLHTMKNCSSCWIISSINKLLFWFTIFMRQSVYGRWNEANKANIKVFLTECWLLAHNHVQSEPVACCDKRTDKCENNIWLCCEHPTFKFVKNLKHILLNEQAGCACVQTPGVSQNEKRLPHAPAQLHLPACP